MVKTGQVCLNVNRCDIFLLFRNYKNYCSLFMYRLIIIIKTLMIGVFQMIQQGLPYKKDHCQREGKRDVWKTLTDVIVQTVMLCQALQNQYNAKSKRNFKSYQRQISHVKLVSGVFKYMRLILVLRENVRLLWGRMQASLSNIPYVDMSALL